MGKRKILHSIPDLCTGCRTCELMCSLTKTGIMNPYLARIRISSRSGGIGSVPTLCRHCKNPPCKSACPVPEAMYLDEQTGAVVIKETECIGCLACVDACPFGAIQVGPNNEVLKCDLCGGEPVCVKYCPPRPENSLRHLPGPKQSCLQYIEPERMNDNKLLSALAKGEEVQVFKEVDIRKHFQVAPPTAKEGAK